MGKNILWFKHDYDASSDPKLSALLSKYGIAGKGVFWTVIEMLHCAPGHKLPLEEYLYVSIDEDSKSVEEIITYAINICKLFVTDGEFFWSERVFDSILELESTSLKKSEAGKKGALVTNEILKARREAKIAVTQY